MRRLLTVALSYCLLLFTINEQSAASELSIIDACKLSNQNGDNINLGLPRNNLLLTSRGTVKVLVAGVDFANARETDTPEKMIDGFDLTTVRDFFAQSSYGQLNLDFTVVGEVVKLPINDTGISDTAVANETVKYLPPRYKLPDFKALLIVTTKNSSYFSSTASAATTLTNASGSLTNYSVLAGIKPNENRWLSSPWRTVAHEIGHLLGLMDLWNREDSTAWEGKTSAPFSIMNTGAGWGYAADFFAWEKWVLGWIPDSDVKCITKDPMDQEVSLKSLDNPDGIRLVVIPINSIEAVAIEYRKKSSLDFGILKPGVLVYRVNTTRKNFELPITLIPSDTSLVRAFSPDFRDFERYKEAPLKTYDSVGAEGIQIANLGVETGKGLLISSKSRIDVKQAMLELQQSASRPVETVKPVPPLKTTIVCVRGKTLKKVAGIRPKCPSGYKKK